MFFLLFALCQLGETAGVDPREELLTKLDESLKPSDQARSRLLRGLSEEYSYSYGDCWRLSFAGPNVITTDLWTESAAAVADVDADSDVDILLTEASRIAWYEQDGGAFKKHVLADGVQALSLAVGDLDGDQDLDAIAGLAASMTNNDTVVWFESDGGSPPNFTKHVIMTAYDVVDTAYQAELLLVLSLDVGDIDGDQDLDCLASYTGGDAASRATVWFENDGGGTFTRYPIGFGFAYSVLADIDGDQDLDCVAADPFYTLTWYENEGQTWTRRFIDLDAWNSDVVAVADIDGDLDPDILSAYYASGTSSVVWYQNSGGGTFEKYVIDTGDHAPTSIATADLDGDYHLDVLVSRKLGDKLVWFEGSGTPDPVFTRHVITKTLEGATFVTATDIDGDDQLDALATSNDGLVWYTGDCILRPTPSPTPVPTLPRFDRYDPVYIDDDPDEPKEVAVGDLDSDGHLDIIVVTSGDELRFYKNHGGADDFTRAFIADDFENLASVIDLDGDYDLDILGTPASVHTVTWFENDGAATFTRHDMATAAWLPSVTRGGAAGIDGDQDTDILVSSYHSHYIAYFENDGGVFTEETIIATETYNAEDVIAGDMDGDTDLDFFAVERAHGILAWWENDGTSSPTFTKHTIAGPIGNGCWFWAPTVADLNGDGLSDILLGELNTCGYNTNSYQMSVYWNNNSGATFVKEVIINFGPVSASTTAADVDGDLDLDIIYGYNGIRWLQNDGAASPTFTWRDRFSFWDDAAFVVGDLDGDGLLDLVTVSRNYDGVAWIRNTGPLPRSPMPTPIPAAGLRLLRSRPSDRLRCRLRRPR